MSESVHRLIVLRENTQGQQLGGRQVALDGQPVRPSGEVNVNKKYQLIALSAE